MEDRFYSFEDFGRARLCIGKNPTIPHKLVIKRKLSDCFGDCMLLAEHFGPVSVLRRKLRVITKRTNLFIDQF